MAGKTKLGRNPFSKKTAPLKPRPVAKKSGAARTSDTARTKSWILFSSWRRQRDVVEQLKKAVRFVSIEAPIGICFLTYRVCSLSFRSAARRV